MANIVRSCKFLNVYNCVNAFMQSDAEGIKQVKMLSPDMQNKLFKCMWEVKGKPMGDSEFGRNAMLNPVEYQRWRPQPATKEQKAQAVEKFLNESMPAKLKKEFDDAKKQQNVQTTFTQFTNAQSVNKDFNKYKAWTLYIVGGLICATILLIPLGAFLIYLANKAYDFADEKEYLSKPSREIGVAHMKGRRDSMEDEHLVTDISFNCGNQVAQAEIYGIFDGHAGRDAAVHLKHHFAEELKKSLEKFHRIGSPQKGISDERVFAALKEAFVNVDKSYHGDAGSTATVAVVLNDNLWVANVGDARTVLNNGGTAIQLSEDQKCDNEKYVKGVRKRGGQIIPGRVPRVNGNLAVPRAVGDHGLKGNLGENCIVHTPKITKYALKDLQKNSSLILACDGVWDVCSSKQAVDFVSSEQDKSPERIAEGLIVKAYNANSEDNLSAMVIKFS